MTNIKPASDFGRVAVLTGGWGSEREVSLMSGAEVLKALQSKGIDAFSIDADHSFAAQIKEANPDRIFLIMHGNDGESGLIQATLDSLQIPYTGSDFSACAFTLDKLRCKWLWQGAGLPVPEFAVLNDESDLDATVDRLGLPLFVKPARHGSSIGITKVSQASELAAAYQEAKKYDDIVIVERFIDGGEYTVSIVGDQVLPSIRIETPHEFYDYQAKYFVDTTNYFCPAGLSAEEEQQLRDLAWQAYQACGCRHWGRVDFMRTSSGEFHLIEINTIPGMTTHSLVPMAGKAEGISYADLVVKILEQTLS